MKKNPIRKRNFDSFLIPDGNKHILETKSEANPELVLHVSFCNSTRARLTRTVLKPSAPNKKLGSVMCLTTTPFPSAASKASGDS